MALAGEVTNPQTLETRDVSFVSDNFNMKAYLARPKAPGSYPGVLVLHEAFGLVAHDRDIASRFANAGFIALAPDMYSRVGAPDPNDIKSVLPKMFSLPDGQLVRDFEAAAACLRAQPGCNGKVGCVGFCVGGRWTLLFACSSAAVNAAIDCWGGFIARANFEETTTPERPTPVLNLVPHLHCPLYAVFGEEDQNPSPADGEALYRALLRAGFTNTQMVGDRERTADSTQPGAYWGDRNVLETYGGAGHAFLADYRPSYREKPAFELWPRMVAFFQTHLK